MWRFPRAMIAVQPLGVWAVDVSAWNCAPYTRVDARGRRSMDVRSMSLEHDVGTLVRPYDADGAEKVERYLRPVDRVRSLVARLLPRLLLASEGVPWSEVRVATTPSGRPYFCGRGAERYDFNLTHDGDWVVMAFCAAPGVRIGLDVMEVALPAFEDSVASFCQTMAQSMTEAEQAYVQGTPDDRDRLARLMELWTYKEAYTKSIGEGLGCDFQKIEVALWATPVQLTVRGMHVDGVHFLELALPQTARSGAPEARIAVARLGDDGCVPMPADPTAAAPARMCTTSAHAIDEGWLSIWSYDAFLANAHAVHTPPGGSGAR